MLTHDTAREAADAAAGAIRDLVHVTRPAAAGLSDPTDVYDVLGALDTLTQHLPQALGQLGDWLIREVQADRIRVPHGQHDGDPISAVAELHTALNAAAAAAGELQRALARAHNIASTLSR